MILSYELSRNSGEERMKSAVRLFVAKGILERDASLTRLITSFWCPCIMRLSQKNTSMSTLSSAIIDPICASPPRGPLRSLVTSGASSPNTSRRAASIRRPVVPVQNSSHSFSEPALNFTQLTSSCFLASCATNAIFFIMIRFSVLS